QYNQTEPMRVCGSVKSTITTRSAPRRTSRSTSPSPSSATWQASPHRRARPWATPAPSFPAPRAPRRPRRRPSRPSACRWARPPAAPPTWSRRLSPPERAAVGGWPFATRRSAAPIRPVRYSSRRIVPPEHEPAAEVSNRSPWVARRLRGWVAREQGIDTPPRQTAAGAALSHYRGNDYLDHHAPGGGTGRDPAAAAPAPPVAPSAGGRGRSRRAELARGGGARHRHLRGHRLLPGTGLGALGGRRPCGHSGLAARSWGSTQRSPG